jgi:hypothetical protein
MEHCSNNGMYSELDDYLCTCFFVEFPLVFWFYRPKHAETQWRSWSHVAYKSTLEVSMQQFTSRLRHCTTARSQFAWESVCKLSCLLGHRWSLKVKWVGGNFWEKSIVCFLYFKSFGTKKNEWLTPYISIYFIYVFSFFSGGLSRRNPTILNHWRAVSCVDFSMVNLLGTCSLKQAKWKVVNWRECIHI